MIGCFLQDIYAIHGRFGQETGNARDHATGAKGAEHTLLGMWVMDARGEAITREAVKEARQHGVYILTFLPQQIESDSRLGHDSIYNLILEPRERIKEYAVVLQVRPHEQHPPPRSRGAVLRPLLVSVGCRHLKCVLTFLVCIGIATMHSA